MNKKTLSLLLALSVVLTVPMSGCSNKSSSANGKESVEKEPANFNKTGLPISKEKVDIKVAASKRSDVKNFGELKFFKDIEEKTNVHVNWECIPDEAWNEKRGLMFASSDLPDAFYGNWALPDTDILKYGSQGMLIPLEKYIDKYSVNLKKILDKNPEYKKLLTAPDGHIYALPAIDELNPEVVDAFMINKKWLDKVGMQVPKTMDEFSNVLRAFKGKDLNENGKSDEIPMTFRFQDNIRGIYSLFGSFGLLDSRDHIQMDGDKVVYTAIQPEYKEAIKYFHQLLSEGLIDPEAFTQDSKTLNSKLQSKTPIVGAFTAWSRTWAFGKTDCDYEVVAPLKGAKGTQLWNRQPTGLRSKGAFAITSSCKNPQVAIRWIDEMYEPKTAYQAQNGLIGETLKENSDGSMEFLELPAGKTFEQVRHQSTPGASCLSAIQKDFASKIKETPNSAGKEKRELNEFYKPFTPKTIYPLLFLTVEENEKMANLQTDIGAYADQMYAKWMLKGGIDEEWDAYVKKIKSMGLDDLVKIKQDAYNRYKSIK